MLEHVVLVLDKYCFEFDPKGLLHLHGVFRAKSNYYKNRVLRKGFHQHILKLESQDDIVRWMIYIHKDHENRFLNDQLLIESDPEYWRVRDELSKHKLEQIYKTSIRVGAAAKLKFTPMYKIILFC